LDLPPNLNPKLVKKIIPIGFPSHLLKSAWVESTFPYALLPRHKGAKQNTIGVITRANAKLPHHKGHVSAYPMEYKMPLYITPYNDRDAII
jgi:hypothetical protein